MAEEAVVVVKCKKADNVVEEINRTVKEGVQTLTEVTADVEVREVKAKVREMRMVNKEDHTAQEVRVVSNNHTVQEATVNTNHIVQEAMVNTSHIVQEARVEKEEATAVETEVAQEVEMEATTRMLQLTPKKRSTERKLFRELPMRTRSYESSGANTTTHYFS